MSDKKAITTQDQLTDFQLYNTPNGRIKVEVLLYEETIWLPQRRIAELFGVDVSTVNEHIKNGSSGKCVLKLGAV